MVQGTQAIKVIKDILFRFALLIVVLVATYFSTDIFHNLNDSTFHYINPPGFFAMASLAEWFLALDLALIFWSGVIFGALGKKSDYIFIVLIILYAFWGYSGTSNVTSQMYLGLIGVAVLGNFLGYILKIGRQNWLGHAS
jgi:hypothetical protein